MNLNVLFIFSAPDMTELIPRYTREVAIVFY